MAIEKMVLLHISGTTHALDPVLHECCESGCCHLEPVQSMLVSGVEEQSLIRAGSNPHAELYRRLLLLADSFSHSLHYRDNRELSLTESEQIDAWISAAESEWQEREGRRQAATRELEERERMLVQVRHLSGLDVDVRELLQAKHVRFRFGRLPADSYLKLEYYGDKSFFFFPFDRDQYSYWGIYCAPAKLETEIDKIFSDLYFEPVPLPEDLDGTAVEMATSLSLRIEKLHQELAALSADNEKFLAGHSEMLDMLYSLLRYRYDLFELRRSVVLLKHGFCLSAYVPKRNIASFIRRIDGISEASVEKDDGAQKRGAVPPVQLRNHAIFRPFEMFVRMYGLPSYDSMDPTPFLAVTYMLLFGLMFGDVGQGAAIMLVGVLLSRLKGSNFGKMLIRIGLSSALFGFLYGSVFGYEHWLDPVYKALFGLHEKPVEALRQSNTFLMLAVGIGVVLIALSMILNIFVSLRKRDYEKALFSPNGVAGIVLYLFVCAAVALPMLLDISVTTPLFIILFAVIPLLLMLFREPLGNLCARKSHIAPEDGYGEYLASSFFELFESLLSYLTNTLSFLRVGGFILSHAGMMLVVMTLSEMAGTGGAPIVVIIGNAFVIVLEGLIVGIQVMRLEFYEMFGRFFESAGSPFEPAHIRYENTPR